MKHFPLGDKQGCDKPAVGVGIPGGAESLEMTHGTNLEVSGFPPTLDLPILWPESLFEGKEENASTSFANGLNIFIHHHRVLQALAETTALCSESLKSWHHLKAPQSITYIYWRLSMSPARRGRSKV